MIYELFLCSAFFRFGFDVMKKIAQPYFCLKIEKEDNSTNQHKKADPPMPKCEKIGRKRWG